MELKNQDFSNIRMGAAAKALVVGTEVSALRPLHGLTITNVIGTHTGITLANMTGVVIKNVVPGVAPATPPTATAAGQPAPGPIFGIVNVTGTGLEGAVAIPAPVDPPPGNAAGFGPGSGGRGARGARGGPAGAAPGTPPPGTPPATPPPVPARP